jgi:hypothetical protein
VRVLLGNVPCLVRWYDMQRELKWAAGKPSEYLLLNEATGVAPARGEMQKAGQLMQRSVQVSDRLGFKEMPADAEPGFAIALAERSSGGSFSSRLKVGTKPKVVLRLATSRLWPVSLTQLVALPCHFPLLQFVDNIHCTLM